MSSDPASSKEEDEKTKVQKIETKAALEALAQAFKKLDVNHDGSISKQEFVAGVMKDKEIQDILHMHMVSAPPKSEKSPQNSERRGSLKMREKDMKRRAARTRNLGIALEYFKRFDTDNSGAIDVNEFSTFFHSKDLENMIEETLKKPIVETKNLSQDDCKMLQQLFGILDSDERCKQAGHHPTHTRRSFPNINWARPEGPKKGEVVIRVCLSFRFRIQRPSIVRGTL